MPEKEKVIQATEEVAKTIVEADDPKTMIKILVVVGGVTVVGYVGYKFYNKYFKKDKEILTEEDITVAIDEAVKEVEDETEE